jgi:hypothetical protein
MKSKMKLEIVEAFTVKHIVTATKAWPEGCREDENLAIAHLKEMINTVGMSSITKKTETIKSDFVVSRVKAEF